MGPGTLTGAGAASGRGRAAQATLAGVALVAVLVLAAALSRNSRLERADFVFVTGGEVASLDPHAVTGIPEGRVLRALYEGLVTRDPRTLEPRPAAAASWEVSDDGLRYRFHLREGARWSNGDALTAQDFEWSLRRVLEPETAAAYAYELWCVEGAREYTTGRDDEGHEVERDWSRVGIEATDAATLELRLARPTPYLLHLLAFHAFFPVHRASLEALQRRYPARWRTQWGRPENLVTNGPFTLALRRVNDRMRLARNPLYWDADAVAFDTIDALALEQWSTALNLYLVGEVDWLDGTIPPLLVPRLTGREDFLRAPYLGIYFLRVNVARPGLDDVRVRRALAMTVPRRLLCDKVLKAGQAPATTIVPWGKLGSYSSPRILGEDAARARELLVEAGYGPDGEPLPPIEIHYNTAESHRDIAEVVADAWRRELGLDVRLRNQEWKVYIDTQSTLGYDVSRSSWIADYPDAIGFLRIFTSGNENNRTGWSSPEFDALIRAAELESAGAARDELLQQAERILLVELPAIPVYSYVTQNLVNPRLGGFSSNLLNEHDPKLWFWKSDVQLRMQRRAGGGQRGQVVAAHGPPEGKFSAAQLRALAATGDDSAVGPEDRR
jgi:oligopeptide transport system substrate-binding protein